MLGRGLLACPDLAKRIKADLQGEDYRPLSWGDICNLLYDYYQQTRPRYLEKNCGNRIKQWLMYLRLQYPQAETFFERIKREREPAAIEQAFAEVLPKNHQAKQRNLAMDTAAL